MTISLRMTLAIFGTVVVLPVLIGLGAKLSTRMELEGLRASNGVLGIENGNFRASTGELTTQIQSLETVIDDLGARSALDPAQAKAMQKLPAVVKARAAGGNAKANAALSNALSTSLISAEDTFGALRSLDRKSVV